MPSVRYVLNSMIPQQCTQRIIRWLDNGGCKGQDQDRCIPYVALLLPQWTLAFTTALVTILSAAIILAITTIEFFDYRRVNVDTSITVDKSRGEKLNVRLNVTFPRVPCYRESSA